MKILILLSYNFSIQATYELLHELINFLKTVIISFFHRLGIALLSAFLLVTKLHSFKLHSNSNSPYYKIMHDLL